MSFDEIVCREFAELATDYLDGAMPEPTLELVEEHLAMCDWCRDYLHHVEATAGAVAATADDARFAPAPPDRTLQSLVGAFRRRTGGGGGPE
jgi:predicted anti-sigma-YlaC factor YlaD